MKTMPKLALVTVVLFFAFIAVTGAQDFKAKDNSLVRNIPSPNQSLKDNEVLEYSVEWLGIQVGRVILKTEGLKDINGHKCYYISAQAFPNNFFRRFYDVDYKVCTYLDAKGLFPRRFEKVRRIKNNSNLVVIDFYQEENKANFYTEGSDEVINFSTLRQELELNNPITTTIPYGTQDIFSAFYYFRLTKVEKDKVYPVNIYYDQRNWPVEMKVGAPFLREIRKKGSLDVFKVYPASNLNAYILGKRKFFVYFTCEPERIPLEFRVNTAIGPFRAILNKPSE